MSHAMEVSEMLSMRETQEPFGYPESEAVAGISDEAGMTMAGAVRSHVERLHDSYREEIAALEADKHRLHEALTWIRDHCGTVPVGEIEAAAQRALAKVRCGT